MSVHSDTSIWIDYIMRRPIVILPACASQTGAYFQHTVQDKYVAAVPPGCVPLLLPALGAATDFETVLAVADGILLTGSVSNVEPGLYGEVARDAGLARDAARDATTLPLIRAALKRGIPLLAICRGFQEINVALGGTLHQALHQVAGMRDHREDRQATLEQQYGPAHRVLIVPDGALARLLDGAAELMVNSLHGQGIARLAPGLTPQAHADDGLIEAFTVEAAPAFALAVQWHPEWGLADNPASQRLLRAFGQACHAHHARRAKGQGAAARS
jgi:putative glutamine amidotransferase